MDPVLAAEAIPDLIERVDDERQVERIRFARFGEEGDSTPVRALNALAEEARTMRALAAELGRALFGPSFRASDFWRERE